MVISFKFQKITLALPKLRANAHLGSEGFLETPRAIDIQTALRP